MVVSVAALLSSLLSGHTLYTTYRLVGIIIRMQTDPRWSVAPRQIVIGHFYFHVSGTLLTTDYLCYFF